MGMLIAFDVSLGVAIYFHIHSSIVGMSVSMRSLQKDLAGPFPFKRKLLWGETPGSRT